MARSTSPHLRTPLLSSQDEGQVRPDGRQRAKPPRADSSQPTNTLLMSAAAMFSFAVLGLFVSTTGVMLPRIKEYYHLNDIAVSLAFLAGPVGYVISAQLNHAVHLRWGRRGIAIIGPIFQLASAVLTAMHPPFPVMLLSLALGAFGAGLIDGSWCAWAGGMPLANLISGLLHGSFSLGAGCGPVWAEVVLAGNVPWYYWFYVLAGLCVLELAFLPFAFRSENAERYLSQSPDENTQDDYTKLSQIFHFKATWICALYLLIYVGTESSISGWIVSFMLRVRHADTQLSSTCSSGFWMGMAVGRFVLGIVTDRFGVKYATAVYINFALVFQIAFVTVKGQTMSVILIALVGFFCGPLFPSSIIWLTKLLPRDLNVGAVSFVASVGQVGGAFLPFGLGVLTQFVGISVFGVVIVIQLAACLVLWLVFTQLKPTQVSGQSEEIENPVENN